MKYIIKKYLKDKDLDKLRLWIKTYHTFVTNLQILCGKLIRIFYRPEFPDLKKHGINIHLGCGSINHKAFINIDGFPFSHVHYVRDISDLSIFDDNSVDLIYASHCLEHFKYDNISSVLAEWTRVLKKGGILRLSVPDFDLLLKIYYDNNLNPNYILPQLLGGQNNKYNYHYMVFNKINLNEKLSNLGFCNIQEWTPGSNEMTTFNDFSNYYKEIDGRKYPVSLNLEAYKI